MIELHLPEYVYLKRKRWTVEIVPHAELECEAKTYGVCDPNTRTISLWDGQPPRQLLSSFIHEYWHAIEFEYGFSIPHRVVFFFERRMASIVWRLIVINAMAARRQRKLRVP